MLPKMPALGMAPEEQQIFPEIWAMRQGLIAQYGEHDFAVEVLADAAASSFLEVKRLTLRSQIYVTEGTKESIRKAETLDRMAARAHTRMVQALESLKLRSRPPVHVSVVATSPALKAEVESQPAPRTPPSPSAAKKSSRRTKSLRSSST
ncbi:MAG: hypothetical protein HYV07_14070 [Deltaproteobacteria bacterium]|nr:hypothetical protein [Deltaproteobacteria bacterium]